MFKNSSYICYTFFAIDDVINEVYLWTYL